MKFILPSPWGFPGGSVPANTGDEGLVPGSWRSPGGGNGYPLQYSCLGNPMNRGTWWATVDGITERWTQLSDWTCMHFLFLACPWLHCFCFPHPLCVVGFIFYSEIEPSLDLSFLLLLPFCIWSNFLFRYVSSCLQRQATGYTKPFAQDRIKSWDTHSYLGISKKISLSILVGSLTQLARVKRMNLQCISYMQSWLLKLGNAFPPS